MRVKRPTSIKVIAIFHFIFGGLGLIWCLLQMVGAVVIYSQPKPAAVAPNPNLPTILAIQPYLDARVPFWREANLAVGVMGLFLSVVLIADGIGLLLYQPWARFVAIGYAALSILYQAGWLIYAAFCVLPVQLAFYEALPAADAQAQNAKAGGKIGVACGSFLPALGLIYPVIVLVVMLLPAVAAAFQQGRPADPADYDLDDSPRRRRRDEEDDVDEENETSGYDDEPDDRFGPAR
jgi:hypothetical protein